MATKTDYAELLSIASREHLGDETRRELERYKSQMDKAASLREEAGRVERGALAVLDRLLVAVRRDDPKATFTMKITTSEDAQGSTN